ncbi:M23 family metallopeptidase [Roseibium sp.]|uniref:M23 family metallopeptidase n=1 Tax=Roseibium sp. TaxID=1936156 RepID=UPI003A97371B
MQFSSPSSSYGQIQLGDEAPLMVHDGRNLLPDRRRVSLRWLTGTVLTGLTSVFLMGGALLAAFQGDYNFAQAALPERTLAFSARVDNASTKGDRITRTTEEFANKQMIPVNVVTRVGDRQLVKVRPYVLMSSSLATRKNRDLAQDIPAFNPLNLYSDIQNVPERFTSDAVFQDSIYGAKVEGQVSISLRAFPTGSTQIDGDATPQEADVEEDVRGSSRFLAASALDAPDSALIDPARFDFNLAKQTEFARLDVRITPENVSFVSKQDDDFRYAGLEEKIVPISSASDIEDVLQDNDASPEEAKQIHQALAQGYGLNKLEAGHRLRIAYAPTMDDSDRMRPERISLYSSTVHQATVARSDSGAYIKANAPTTFLADAFAEADRVSYGGPTPDLYDSIYQTALEQDMSTDMINELMQIFSFEVDFNARVQPGDSLEVFYAQDTETAQPEVLYAALNTGSSRRQFYRFRTPDDGTVDYYDGNGQSAKKFLMRKPVSEGRFVSGFGMRRHPIHKYSKMHTGVDWAASRGTPIMAAGNGTIEKLGWSSSYGRRIELQHANGYTTTYNHMTAFAKGLSEGSKIRQGQIIGYVGSTGLSTGPHLHYEVKVNNRFVDPMRIRLPRGRVLDGDMLAAFRAEQRRVDTLLDKAQKPSRLAAIQ